MYIRFLRHGRKEAHDERYEYDAYGNCSILEPNFAPDPDGKSDYENPYLFTGRRLDILDSGSLKIQYNRNRYYDYYTGRWLTQDPLGITPNAQWSNVFDPVGQYRYGMNIYQYCENNPAISLDPSGLLELIIGCTNFKEESGLGTFTYKKRHKWPESDKTWFGNYRWDIFYQCDLTTNTISKHGSPMLNNVYFSGHSSNPGHPKIGLGLAAAEEVHYIRIPQKSISWSASKCPPGWIGEARKVQFDIEWIKEKRIYITLGVGPIVLPLPAVRVIRSVIAKTTINAELTCCCNPAWQCCCCP